MTDLLEDVAIVTGSNFEGSCICTFQSPFFFPDTSHVVPFPTIRFAREHIDVTKDELRCLTFLSLCSVLFPTVVHVPPTVICNPLQTGALAFNQLQPTAARIQFVSTRGPRLLDASGGALGCFVDSVFETEIDDGPGFCVSSCREEKHEITPSKVYEYTCLKCLWRSKIGVSFNYVASRDTKKRYRDLRAHHIRDRAGHHTLTTGADWFSKLVGGSLIR
ncbi:hypothetical protein MPTK1_2g06690 [Marchantia polymorpha subsp. ruderalis]|uniref:Uncharacterized protein n=1 Tax=Marchantia polymorpha TaxID=3197 RepID=A0A2R6XDU0_MARPO|nr:hypothetical protein MARPO_0021s0122 [Marchantia polymorpha]BBN01342.1 hypothetical protein Mp_2g06690 [Marchantia polymorpha subsp. ruderalis]|eukprot:PTQ44268.1 hypothetical protein MARPO_0021s0122 [Marchantia polymorpha]